MVHKLYVSVEFETNPIDSRNTDLGIIDRDFIASEKYRVETQGTTRRETQDGIL